MRFIFERKFLPLSASSLTFHVEVLTQVVLVVCAALKSRFLCLVPGETFHLQSKHTARSAHKVFC